MKLIVGLGNPGIKYKNNRHNIGFMVLDNILKINKWSTKFQGLYYETTINNEKVIFLKPQTFMNNSGECVVKFVQYFKIKIDDILVVQDDIDIIFKNIKLKNNSSSGGHNGIKSIISSLNSDEFTRLKIGIKNDNINNVINFVLGDFSKEENKYLEENYYFYKNIIYSFINYGLKYTKDHLNNLR